MIFLAWALAGAVGMRTCVVREAVVSGRAEGGSGALRAGSVDSVTESGCCGVCGLGSGLCSGSGAWYGRGSSLVGRGWAGFGRVRRVEGGSGVLGVGSGDGATESGCCGVCGPGLGLCRESGAQFNCEAQLVSGSWGENRLSCVPCVGSGARAGSGRVMVGFVMESNRTGMLLRATEVGSTERRGLT